MSVSVICSQTNQLYDRNFWLTQQTYQQSVFKHYHSSKHSSEFYLQDGGKNQLA